MCSTATYISINMNFDQYVYIRCLHSVEASALKFQYRSGSNISEVRCLHRVHRILNHNSSYIVK